MRCIAGIVGFGHQIFFADEMELDELPHLDNDAGEGRIGSTRLDGHVELSEEQEQEAVLGVDQRLARLVFPVPVDCTSQHSSTSAIVPP